MKIEWIEHLKGTVEGTEFPARTSGSMFSYSEEVSPTFEIMKTQRIAKFDLHLGSRRRVAANISSGELQRIRVQAVQALADTIHGPIITELRAIQEILYGRGTMESDPEMVRIDAMIKALKLADLGDA